MKTILITGSAGFIGYALSKKLLSEGYRIIGIDSITDYYDTSLKKNRENELKKERKFVPINKCIKEPGFLKKIFDTYEPNIVIHLAAQAGVRYSIDNPKSYVDSNILGTYELLEASRYLKPEHLLLASTSSVYGSNTELPYKETQKADEQVSFYAATKKSNESMAHSYSHLYNLPTTIFRFFTVYGPWGRPDMALYKFTNLILDEKPIDIYNDGKLSRDFTYIDDLVTSITLLLNKVPVKNKKISENDSISSSAPYRIVNIGNSVPVNLIDFISEIEKCLGKKAKFNFLPMQDGDVLNTWSDISLLKCLTGYEPKTDLKDGINKFISWYLKYYGK